MGNYFSSTAKAAGKKLAEKEIKKYGYSQSHGQKIYRAYKTGIGITTSEARKKYARDQATKRAVYQAKQAQKSKKSVVSSIFDKLAASGSGVAEARYGWARGDKNVWSNYVKGFKNAWTGKQVRTNEDVIDAKRKYAHEDKKNTMFDALNASFVGGEGSYVKKGKMYYNSGEKMGTSKGLKATTGILEDMIFDPLNFIGTPVKAAGTVLKGSGASLATFRKAADAMKATGEIGEDVWKIAQIEHTRGIAKRLWDKKTRKTDILSGVTTEGIADKMKSMDSVKGLVKDEKVDEIAAETKKAFQKNVMHLDTTADDMRIKVCGTANTTYDKARQSLMKGRLAITEALQKAGDYTISPYWNSMLEAARRSRVGQALSKTNATEDLVKSNMLGYGRKTSAATQVDPVDFAVKQGLESGRLKAEMDKEIMERAEKIRTLVGEMDAEEQLKLLKNLENGNYEQAERLFSVATEDGKTIKDWIEENRSNFDELKRLTMEALQAQDKAKYTPMQYLHFSMYNTMPGLGTTDEDILATLDWADMEMLFEGMDYEKTFLKGASNLDAYIKSGRVNTNSSGIEKVNDAKEVKNAIRLALYQMEKGKMTVAEMMDWFVKRVGSDQAYNFFKANAVFAEDALTKGVKAVEGADAVPKLISGASWEKMANRAALDAKAGGALESSYNALKQSTMEAEAMGVNPAFIKDAKELIALVESKKNATMANLGDVLRSLAPQTRRAIVDSYASTAEGYEALYGKIAGEGESMFEKAREYASRVNDGAFDIEIFLDKEQREFLNEVDKICKFLSGREERMGLGMNFEQNIAHMNTWERDMETALEAGKEFAWQQDHSKMDVAEAFVDEIRDLVKREHEAKIWTDNQWDRYVEEGTSKYVPHIETAEYKAANQAEREQTKGAFSGIYTHIGNPNKLEQSGKIGDRVEDIQRYKENLTEIYLDRALHSNTMLFNRDATNFLYERILKPLDFGGEVMDFEQLIERMQKGGTKLGATYASIQKAMNKKIADKIEKLAEQEARRILEEEIDPMSGISWMDIARSRRSTSVAYENEKARLDEVTRELKGAEDYLRPQVETARNAVMDDLVGTNEAREAYVAQSSLTPDQQDLNNLMHYTTQEMDLNPDDGAEMFKKMGLEGKYKQWQSGAASVRYAQKELATAQKTTLEELEQAIKNLDYSTPYDEEIDKMVEQLNAVRQATDDDALTGQMIEAYNRLADERFSFLLQNNADMSYINQLYQDLQKIGEEYRKLQEEFNYFEQKMKVYDGAMDEVQLMEAFKQKWKEENFTTMFNAEKTAMIDELFGGDQKKIDLFTTNMPLQTLDASDARRLHDMFGETDTVQWFEGADNILEDVNVMSRAQWLAGQKSIVKLYDRFMQLYKVNNTVTSPAFHVQNGMSNAYQSFLAEGAAALDPGYGIKARQILSGNDPNATIVLGGKEYTQRELQLMAQNMGVVDETFGAMEVGEKYTSNTNMSRYKVSDNGVTLPSNLQPLANGKSVSENIQTVQEGQERFKSAVANKIDKGVQTVQRALTYPSTQVGQQLEATQRMSLFLTSLDKGKTPTEALETVNKFLFDYNGLTDFERNVMRRVIPFYTYSKNNLPMHLDALLNTPQRLSPLAKMQNMADANEDEEWALPNKYRSIWTQQYFQIPGTQIGIDPKLPYENAFQRNFDWKDKDMGSDTYGDVTPQSAFASALGLVNNPFINAPITAVTGIQPTIGRNASTPNELGTNLSKAAEGLAGTLGSAVMNIYKYKTEISDLQKEKKAATSAKERKRISEKIATAEKNMVKEVTKYFAIPVDTKMYDYRNWAGNEITYTDYEGNQQKYYSQITQEQADQIYKDTYITPTLEDNGKQRDMGNLTWNRYGDWLVKEGKAKNKQDWFEQAYHLKERYNKQHTQGYIKKSMSYEKWLKKYYDIDQE